MPSRSRSVTPRRPRSVPPRRRASTRLKQTADGSPEPREEQAAVLPAAVPPTPLAVVDFFNWISTFWPYKPLWPLVALFLLMKYEEVNNCAQGFWHSLSYFWHCSVLALLILVFCFTWENVWEKCYQNKTQVMLLTLMLSSFSKAFGSMLKKIMKLDVAGPLEVGNPLQPSFWTDGAPWCSTEWCGEHCEGFNDNELVPITENTELIFLFIFLWNAFAKVKDQVGSMVTKEEATSKGMPATLFDIIDRDKNGDISGEEFKLWWGRQSINVREQIERNMGNNVPA